jgi:hypothetical protein
MATEHDEQVTDLLTGFEDKYHKVLLKLDSLARGTFDEDDATAMAAACLLAQAALLSELSSADLRSRAMKRDIEFAKANAYSSLKGVSIGGKKVTESALAQLILKDDDVKRISNEQNIAEKDYKHLSNIHALLKEAHLTFRSIKRVV